MSHNLNSPFGVQGLNLQGCFIGFRVVKPVSACAPGPWSEIFLAVCEPGCKKGSKLLEEGYMKD